MRPSAEPRTIFDRLSEAAKGSFIGRRDELGIVSGAIQSGDPSFVVAFIHGPGGIGKSSLLQAVLSTVGPAVSSHVMDCREIEPTPHGFHAALGASLGIQESEPELGSIIRRLGETGHRDVLALDTYETFRLMDTWLRQVFVPALPENVFTVIAGREAPNPAWYTSPGWQDLFCEIELGELPDDDAQQMLVSRGLAPPQVDRVIGFARGYPLVLEMAAAALRRHPDLEIADGPPPMVLEQLTHAFLTGLPNETVEAVEAASTVRRVTEPLLRVLLSLSRAREAFAHLEALPFIDVTSEGLIFHDVVRATLAKDLSWRDPERYRTYRKRAWSYFSKQSHRCMAGGLWHCTADMLYLIENPVVRDAFFPKGATDYRVEPAVAGDSTAILSIAQTTEPQEAARFLGQWWSKHPGTFSVAKTRDGEVAAFYAIFDPTAADPALLAEDPVTAAWSRHLHENPVADGERVLFLRRWLARETGEAPSPAQGACWLDIKRTYMALRPSLRRLYTTVTDLATYAPIVLPLGFAPVEEAQAELGGCTYHSAVLDFGPSSVDGWIAGITGAELGTDAVEAGEAAQEGGRRLVTVLFTDIVGSTEKAAELGDRRWRDLLERHHTVVRGELAKFHGTEIDTAGDGFLVTFESPAAAIQCACAISKSVRHLALGIRAGLHLGECEVVGGAVRGIAVHIGARVAGRAGGGEILVSGTVRDAVTGSDIRFQDRGTHALKGIPGDWRLFAVETGSATSSA